MRDLTQEEVRRFCAGLRTSSNETYNYNTTICHGAMALAAKRLQLSGVPLWEVMRGAWKHAGKPPPLCASTFVMNVRGNNLLSMTMFGKGWGACPSMRILTLGEALGESGWTIEQVKADLSGPEDPFNPSQDWLLMVTLTDEDLFIGTNAVFIMNGTLQCTKRLAYAKARRHVHTLLSAIDVPSVPDFPDTTYDCEPDVQFCVCGTRSRVVECRSCGLALYCSNHCRASNVVAHARSCHQVEFFILFRKKELKLRALRLVFGLY